MSEEDDTIELDRSLEKMLSNEDRRTDADDQDEDNVGDEDEQEENGKREKRSRPKKERRPSDSWSLGYYGIFQLSDSLFCDSGYRSSRNVCRTSCTAFTDDNIMDDIACFVRSGYWRRSNMKLGLLVVLAVAVLVPSLSESRIVSKCELKEKLRTAISLPSNLERFREEILALGSRRRREAKSMSEEDDSNELDRSLEKMLSNKDRRTNADDQDEDDESDEGDEERKPSDSWSLGYYGIFQLFDSLFCDSGYRSSRNVCRTSCTAFTDDNIMDDIACFVRSGYWRLQKAKEYCFQSQESDYHRGEFGG
ncbi:hypothetical protein L3Q82_005523 [Scortum barcoo]|uniref:Uncharacterized protein n=1 Tax=Scortum barcoo TaxID=214431 RepID=A0ACB8VDG2_9TELE|nr:hypothetical protein L3Q82_005523 [Scortum barcoo]